MSEKEIEIINLNKRELPELPQLPPMPKPKYQEQQQPQQSRQYLSPIHQYPKPRPLPRIQNNYQNPRIPDKPNQYKSDYKKWFYFALIFAIIFAILFAGNIIWTNTNISSGKLGTYINNTINIEPAQVQVPVNISSQTTNENYNNFTIKIENKIDMENNTNITLDNETINKIVKGVLDKINETI